MDRYNNERPSRSFSALPGYPVPRSALEHIQQLDDFGREEETYLRNRSAMLFNMAVNWGRSPPPHSGNPPTAPAVTSPPNQRLNSAVGTTQNRLSRSNGQPATNQPTGSGGLEAANQYPSQSMTPNHAPIPYSSTTPGHVTQLSHPTIPPVRHTTSVIYGSTMDVFQGPLWLCHTTRHQAPVQQPFSAPTNACGQGQSLLPPLGHYTQSPGLHNPSTTGQPQFFTRPGQVHLPSASPAHPPLGHPSQHPQQPQRSQPVHENEGVPLPPPQSLPPPPPLAPPVPTSNSSESSFFDSSSSAQDEEVDAVSMIVPPNYASVWEMLRQQHALRNAEIAYSKAKADYLNTHAWAARIGALLRRVEMEEEYHRGIQRNMVDTVIGILNNPNASPAQRANAEQWAEHVFLTRPSPSERVFQLMGSMDEGARPMAYPTYPTVNGQSDQPVSSSLVAPSTPPTPIVLQPSLPTQPV